MDHFPEKLIAKINDLIKPAYVQVSDDGLVLDSGGFLSHYGISQPMRGKNVEDELVFLVGFFPPRSNHSNYPILSLSGNCAFRVSFAKDGNTSWIIFTNAEKIGEELQSRVQRRNELSLLRDEQTTILERLGHINENLSNYASVTAHDLRLPAANTQALADIFLDEYADLFDSEGQELLTMMADSAKRMNILISDILENATSPSLTPLRNEVFQTSKVIREIIGSLNVKSTQEIVIAGDLPEINFRRSVFSRIALNLISNAISCSGNNARVEIGFKELEGFWQFSVADNGPGIAKEAQELIWSKAHSEKVASRDKSTGLGLWIVKNLVEQSGGSVWLDSGAKCGSTFCFTIPRA